MHNKTIIAIMITSIFLSITLFTILFFKEQAVPVVQSDITTKKEIESTSVFLNTKEASTFLGISEEQFNTMLILEKQQLIQNGSFNGTMIPYITIDSTYYFTEESLILWAAVSTKENRNYDEWLGQ
ncbi:hypothetical protein KUV80_13990 [Fictibacillus nanhaiensis]|uniref:hypothetical protein n=1 Tax=Fictibacillus nanhaiensis TaxID=742169 RepID=UPI001C98751F|nr:hypothetical protein [Fictibacillus nanhaiensis]MBY6037778.1 hypothetical protein [Fictibacillus nanhaiensis]